jgi:hypothetical protein
LTASGHVAPKVCDKVICGLTGKLAAKMLFGSVQVVVFCAQPADDAVAAGTAALAVSVTFTAGE